MPTNFFSVPVSNRKKYKLLLLLLLSPLFFYAQSSLTGLWVGALSNDSTTVRKDQSFEIALTEYKGKVYGYSRSEFIVDDVLYYIVKRVKGTIEGNVCEVTDDDIVSYNFPRKLDKNIKVTSTFRRNDNDSAWHLDGKWKTNATKKYYSVSGRVALESEPDLTASKIFPHLEELKLADDVAFYKDRKEGQPIVRIAKPEKADLEFAAKTEKLLMEKDVAVSSNKTLTQKIDPTNIPVKPIANNIKEITATSDEVVKDTKKDVQKNEMSKEILNNSSSTDQKNIVALNKNNSAAPGGNTNAGINNPSEKENLKEAVVKNNPEKKNEISSTTETTIKNNPQTIVSPDNNKEITQTNKSDKNNEVKKPTAVNNNIQPNNSVASSQPTVTAKPDAKNINSKTTVSTPIKTDAVKEDVVIKNTVPSETKLLATLPSISEIKKSTEDITLKAAVIAGRKSEFSQVVNFKSDSLQIALYDNGEIDGDTVSVFMNGEVILAQQGLKSSAIRKTIYLPTGQTDEFTLVMFAESLGKYPPNTGLLVIRDGNDVYNLRFSSDFQKNAGIVFRRKK